MVSGKSIYKDLKSNFTLGFDINSQALYNGAVSPVIPVKTAS